MTNQLIKQLLVLCAFTALVASAWLFSAADAKELQTCPCPALIGPASICPNTNQNLAVVNAPAGAFAAFSVPPGSTGNIVSQSGLTAVVNQPGTYLATVCFPLSITIPTGTNCVNCNNPLVTASLSSNVPGNPATVTICQTGPFPSTVVLTCNTNVPVNPATTRYRFFSNGVLVADSPSNTLTVGLASFVGNAAAYTCRAVTQNLQCVSAPSNTITVLKCTGGAPCPSSVAITLSGSCPSISITAVIGNPQPGVTYTVTLLRSLAPGGPFSVFSSQIVGPFAVVPPGGILVVFSGLPLPAAFYRVSVSVVNCPQVLSNIIGTPSCCPNVGAVLSSNLPGNPSTLTICSTPPGPSSITLTCSPTLLVGPGTLFRFLRNGVVVQETGDNHLAVTFAQFAMLPFATYQCQVITSPGPCVGPLSNTISVVRCAGGGACPTSVTANFVGSCPNINIRAVIGNPQTGVAYTFTLRRSVTLAGTFVPINSQVVGPFAVIPPGGIAAVFSGFSPGSAFFIVDVTAPGCPTISSNVLNFSGCLTTP